MNQRIAINGFGRIGRCVLRVLLETGSDLEVVAINDLAGSDTLAHLFNFDSVYGPAPDRARVESTAEGDVLIVANRRIRLFSEADPTRLPWGALGVGTVLEATGRFTKGDTPRMHLAAGAERVLVSAPAEQAQATLVRGINWEGFQTAEHQVLSTASCTTNALAPLARVLHEVAGIEQGIVSTVHAYTGDQHLVDGAHRDLRRARAAALNIVPTSTGAAKAIGLVLPELDGKLIGDALRVPVPTGSLVELTAVVSRDVTAAELDRAYREADGGALHKVLRYSDDPLVSSDIVGDPASAVFDAGLTRVIGRQVRVTAWYDNEWGFSHRAAETLELLAGLRAAA